MRLSPNTLAPLPRPPPPSHGHLVGGSRACGAVCVLLWLLWLGGLGCLTGGSLSARGVFFFGAFLGGRQLLQPIIDDLVPKALQKCPAPSISLRNRAKQGKSAEPKVSRAQLMNTGNEKRDTEDEAQTPRHPPHA